MMIGENAIIKIGDDCFFNNDCSLNSLNSITIGNRTIFGENVKIYDHNHKYNKKNIPIKQQGYSVGQVVIGHDCWIGSNVVILKGAHIGDNCVIGAGVVISSKIEDGSLVKLNENYSLHQVRSKV